MQKTLDRTRKALSIPQECPRTKSGQVQSVVNFELILYPENKDDMYLLHKCTSLWDYAYAMHDKDVYEDDKRDENGDYVYKKGDQKKPHIHLLVFLNATTQIHVLQEFLNIPFSRIEKVKSVKGAIRYLIHLDNYEKYTYQLKDIVTNVPDRVRIALSTNLVQFEEENIIKILDDVRNCQSFTELVFLSAVSGRWSTLRRMGTFATRIFDETQVSRTYKHKDLVESIFNKHNFNNELLWKEIGDIYV